MGTSRTDQAWKALEAHAAAMRGAHMRDLFAADPNRFDRFATEVCGIFLDPSKNILTDETLALLVDLAKSADVEGARTRMFAGAAINTTEQRAVLHTALRAPLDADIRVDGENVMPLVGSVLSRMGALCEGIRNGTRVGATGKRFTDVINLGIGGSQLGPQLAVEALAPFAADDVRVHFVSSTDKAAISSLLQDLSWESTLCIVASKGFSTAETMLNAAFVRDWFMGAGGDPDAIGRHFVAVTARADLARDFGIAEDDIFEMWDWVGGRYSVWSAIGLPVALRIGMDGFRHFLEGARDMDRHFQDAPLSRNLPVLMALLGVWYINFHDAQSHAVIPYARRLQRLPSYLQQLEMESNGKRATLDGAPVSHATVPVVWGGTGSDVQHSYFQKFHQGQGFVPIDFIAVAETDVRSDPYGRLLLSNCFAQSETLMMGKSEAAARAELEGEGCPPSDIERLVQHRVFPGNRPSNTMVLRSLDPKTLGALIALYEHKVFVQGVIWNINSFDQWGVELGKVIARDVDARLRGEARGEVSASTEGLIRVAGGADSGSA